MKELIEVLEALASKRAEVKNPLELFLDMAERVVKAAGSMFGAKPDEVAILVLTSDGRHLRFVAPRQFAELGTIPITKRDSIAVAVLARKAGEAANNVPMVRHVAFFEAVKLRDRAVPIQKMITVPILLGGEACGVAQISRKAETQLEAGPDFTVLDVQRAQELFEAVAPALIKGRPEKF